MQAVTGDMVQTVAVRWKRMCEDLHYQQLLSGTWHLPQRVQLSVKGWMFHLCAYRFPDETEEVNSCVYEFCYLCIIVCVGYVRTCVRGGGSRCGQCPCHLL